MIQAVIVIVGALMMLGAFLGALFNMSKMVDPDSSFESGFKAHLGAMGVMAIGMLLSLGGTLWYVLDAAANMQ